MTSQADRTARAGASSGRRDHRPAARLGAALALVLIAAAAFLATGFAGFVAQVAGQARAVGGAASADGIVVLTGGRARLEAAVALLREGRGERLLVSGVHAELGEGALRRALGVSADLYACCIDIDRDALDTAGNARGSAAWAERNGYLSLIVVTNDYHVPRSMLEMRRAMPDRALAAHPVLNAGPEPAGPAATFDRYRVLAGEYGKYLVAKARGLSN